MSLSPCDVRWCDRLVGFHCLTCGDEAEHAEMIRGACQRVRVVVADNPPAATTADPYAALRAILDAAYEQAAIGKGSERHANGRPWTEQPIFTVTRQCGVGFPAGQAMKKIGEAMGMIARGEHDRARAELLGAIVYAAAAAHVCGEGRE